jgi:hypothetical protein
MEDTIVKSAVGEADMDAWEVPFKSVLGFLLKASLLAARFGLGEEAERILAPVEAVRPRHASTHLARALVRIYLGRHQEAVEGLENGLLKDEPLHDMARAIKALGEFHLGRFGECRALVRALQEQAAADPLSVCGEARDLAASLASEIGMA